MEASQAKTLSLWEQNLIQRSNKKYKWKCNSDPLN